MTADFVTSEDPREAEVHNGIERLCDPTHVRALTMAEFRELYRLCGLSIIAEYPRRLNNELDEWILHGGPVPEVEAEIRRRFREALQGDETGLRVRDEGGKIRFTHQTLLLVGAPTGEGSPSGS